MSTDIQILRSQEYSTNLELLSQQKRPKVAPYVMEQSAQGSKAFRMMSQIDGTEAVEQTTSAKPAMNIDVPHDGRWVYPRMFAWGKVVDDIDLLQTSIAPQGAYTQTAIAAMNRKQDDLFLEAFFGDARTGETGSTTTSFDSNNQVAAASSGLTLAKIREAVEGMEAYDVDLDMEPVYIAVTPKQKSDVLALTNATSGDFVMGKPLETNVMPGLYGVTFVLCNRLPVDGSGNRRLPVWVPSGMGKGLWKPISGVVRDRPDLQGKPDYVEASMMEGYTRLEEKKCFEIKCAE